VAGLVPVLSGITDYGFVLVTVSLLASTVMGLPPSVEYPNAIVVKDSKVIPVASADGPVISGTSFADSDAPPGLIREAT
jgi:hypothetical protein